MKRYLLWGAGFVVLILINALVEIVLLPLWGLDDTPENDLYFKLWWVAVGVWLLFGLRFLGRSRQDDFEQEARGSED